MNQQDKLIYEHIADKTLSFGCKVLYNFQSKDMWDESTVWKYISYNWDYHSIQSPYWKHWLKGWFEILWHDIHIGHCLKWIEENGINTEDCSWCDIWEEKRDLHRLYKNKSETLMHPENLQAKKYMLTLIENA